MLSVNRLYACIHESLAGFKTCQGDKLLYFHASSIQTENLKSFSPLRNDWYHTLSHHAVHHLHLRVVLTHRPQRHARVLTMKDIAPSCSYLSVTLTIFDSNRNIWVILHFSHQLLPLSTYWLKRTRCSAFGGLLTLKRLRVSGDVCALFLHDSSCLSGVFPSTSSMPAVAAEASELASEEDWVSPFPSLTVRFFFTFGEVESGSDDRELDC